MTFSFPENDVYFFPILRRPGCRAGVRIRYEIVCPIRPADICIRGFTQIIITDPVPKDKKILK